MEQEEIAKTEEWVQYEKGKDHLRKTNYYNTVEKCFNFYKGDQWHGANLGDIPAVQYNFIKPVVNYKTSALDGYEYNIIFHSNNFESDEQSKKMEQVCKVLNTHVSVIWELKHMNGKMRRMKKDGAIAGEGVLYFYFKKDGGDNELINDVADGEFEAEKILTTDIYYGNENDSDIQSQPYILIKQRLPLVTVQNMAQRNGLSAEEIKKITADTDTAEEIGEASKYEVNDNVLVITKFYKKDGTVHCKKSTRQVVVQDEKDLGLTLYPIAHYNWNDDVGNARGIGEVEYLIPNQIEANKTLMRRVAIIKMIAYPKPVVNIDKIKNRQALEKVGATIELSGGIDNINNYFGYIQPQATSPEAKALQDEIITTSRELANASEVSTGAINPERASGRAVLAIQQASQQPLNEQLYRYKELLEDIGEIIFDIWRAYNVKGMKAYSRVDNTDLAKIDDGSANYEIVNISAKDLKDLKPYIKIEETPRTPYDRLAQEQSYENLLVKGLISFEEYVELLGEDSSMDKKQLIKLIQKRQEKQAQIQAMQEEANAQATDLQNQMALEQTANQVETDVDINRITDQTAQQAEAMLGGLR